MNSVKSLIFFLFGGAAVVGLLMLTSYTDTKPTNNNEGDAAPQDTFPVMVQKVTAPRLPSAVNFAGEPVPLENFDTYERLDRELLGNCFRHSKTIGNLKRASRFFPVIEPILEKNNVPDDIKYLAVAESDLKNLVSPAGAAGFWQFMKDTGREYGMEVSSEVDQRYDLEMATEAACKYLTKSKNKFGSWTLAAAAYNMGGGRLRQRLSEQGEDSKYFDLYLNRETSRYVPRIVTIKEVMSNPTRYGFTLEEEDLYPPATEYREEKVSGYIESWPRWAEEHKVSFRELRTMNPWIRSTRLTNKYKKTYNVKLPK